jgi:hypothetical protein
MNVCAICDKDVYGTKWFCYGCYKQWKDSILAKEPWIMALINFERKRRRQVKKDNNIIYLGDKLDVDENHNIVRIGYESR